MPLQCRTYGLHQNHLPIDSIWKGQPMRWKRCCNAGPGWCEFLHLWGVFSGKRKWFNVPKGVRKLSFCSWTLSSCLIKIILSQGEGGLDLAGKVLPLPSQSTRDTQSNKHPLWWKNGGSRWGKDDAQRDIHWQSCYSVRPQYDSRVCALIITNLVQKILHLATDTTDYTKKGKQTSKIPKPT